MGSSVGEIFAHDPDEGPNAVVQYSIIGEIVFLAFIIYVPSVPLFESYSLNFKFRCYTYRGTANEKYPNPHFC